MAIRAQVANFLSQVGPAVKAAASNSVEQARTFAVHAGGAASNALQNLGTATGAALSGTPTPTTYYGKTNVVASPGGINPGGVLGAVGMKGMASKLQAAYQDPRTAQMIGAGVLGGGALGLTAAAGIGYMQNQRRKDRIAGQKLGAQLGVAMPPQY